MNINSTEKYSVIIPSFNEREYLAPLVESVLPLVDHVIVVDDGSKIPCTSFLPSHGKLHVVTHKINLGKGAAMKTGCILAKKLGIDIVIFMDADGQHVAGDILKFLEGFKDKSIDIIFGSRVIGKDMPLIKMVGNKFLSIAASLLFGIYISDTQSGYRGFRLHAFDKLKWESSRYSVETEIVAKAGKNKLKIKEIEIQTIYHDQYKGTTIIDGIRIFFNMLTWKFL